jgi:hypothetical protein
MSFINTISKPDLIRLKAPNYIFGQSFTATKNTVTVIDIPIPVKFALTGAEFWVQDHKYSSYFNGYLFDVDNILGQGPGPLGQFAVNRHIADKTVHVMDLDIATSILVDGLYFRIVYTNVETDDLAEDATGWVNFKGYNLDNAGI